MKQIVKDIYHHNKGKVTKLQWVGENPVNREYSIWIKPNGELIEVFNADLQTQFMYSISEYDMKCRAMEWQKAQVKLTEIWFSNNSK